MFQPLDEQTRKAANTKLVHYGIQNELSDWRIHVGWGSQHIVAFPTGSGRRLIEARQVKTDKSGVTYSGDGLKTVTQRGYETAKGYAIAISHIDGAVEILIPPDIYRKYLVSTNDSTSHKGNTAVAVVIDMLRKHLIPLPCTYDVTTDKALQVSGQDIVINSNLRVQVKMDWLAGSKSHGGTGNVFLQVGECNPFKMH
jgi:hypothetical protein